MHWPKNWLAILCLAIVATAANAERLIETAQRAGVASQPTSTIPESATTSVVVPTPTDRARKVAPPSTSEAAASSENSIQLNRQISLGDAATSITAIIALVALWFAWHQVREARKQRHSQMTQHVFDILGSKTSRELRRYVYNHIPAHPPMDLSPAEWAKIEDVWNEFERVAQYVYRQLVDKDAIIEMYAFGIIVSWKKLQPYADFQAERRGAPNRDGVPSVFLQGFRRLAADAEAHWRIHYPNREVPCVVEWLPNYQEHSKVRQTVVQRKCRRRRGGA